jgi:hypothetical protein
MKTLTQHIKESLTKKSIKEVSKEKTVGEDSASFMRASPINGSTIARGTTRNEEEKK